MSCSFLTQDHLEPNLSCSPAYYIGKLNSMSNVSDSYIHLSIRSFHSSIAHPSIHTFNHQSIKLIFSSFLKALFISPSASSTTDEDLDLANSRIKVIESLKTALRTQPLSFVVRFVEMEGFQSLLDILQLKGQHSMNLRGPTIGCIKALMNCSVSENVMLRSCDDARVADVDNHLLPGGTGARSQSS